MTRATTFARTAAALGTWLILLGALTAGFAIWQLWGTGLLAARSQQQLSNQFDTFLEHNHLQLPDTQPEKRTQPETGTARTGPGGTPQPLPSGDTATTPPAATPSTGEPAGAGATYTLLAALGTPIAHLSIPSAGVDNLVVLGDRRSDLRQGPGLAATMTAPGSAAGNTVIAGHRTSYGAPFYNLDNVKNGDEIVIQALYGEYLYVVYETVIVDDTDEQIMTQTAEPTLTIYTCHPLHSSAQRLVVRAKPVTTSGKVISIEPADVPEPQLVANTATTPGPADQTAANSRPETSDQPAGTTPPVLTTERNETFGNDDQTRADTHTANNNVPAATAADRVDEQTFSRDPKLWAGGALLLALLAVIKELFARWSRRTHRAIIWLAAPIALPVVLAFYMIVERILPAGI